MHIVKSGMCSLASVDLQVCGSAFPHYQIGKNTLVIRPALLKIRPLPGARKVGRSYKTSHVLERAQRGRRVETVSLLRAKASKECP